MPVGQNLEAGARITELLLVTEAKGVDGLSEQRSEGRAAWPTHVHISWMYVAECGVRRGIDVWIVMVGFHTMIE